MLKGRPKQGLSLFCAKITLPIMEDLLLKGDFDMDMKKTITIAVIGVEAIACGVFSALCFARAQYHQGRIDAAKELQAEMLKLKAEIIRKENSSKKES